MTYLIGFFVFILGTIVGSFLNVVSLRYGSGMSISRGRSICFSCGKVLSWWELLPIISFIGLRGRCEKCKSKISFQYPLIELLTGTIFLLIFLKFARFLLLLDPFYFLLSTFYLLVFSLLIVITIYDFRHKIIPNGLVYLFIVLSLLHALVAFDYPLLTTSYFLNLLAGPLLFTPFFLLWFFSKGRWMGFGDAKLSLGIGFLLGLQAGISAIVLAFWIGAASSLLIIGLEKLRRRFSTIFLLTFLPRHLSMKSEIPFGPFLILGAAVVFFSGISIADLFFL